MTPEQAPGDCAATTCCATHVKRWQEGNQMIRLGKEVRLLEWGEGTNTLNQVWKEFGKGTLRARPKRKMGVTIITVEVDGAVQKQNTKDPHVKIMQEDEVMTPPVSSVTGNQRWGEVAMAKLKDITSENGKSIVELAITNAIKIGNTGPG